MKLYVFYLKLIYILIKQIISIIYAFTRFCQPSCNPDTKAMTVAELHSSSSQRKAKGVTPLNSKELSLYIYYGFYPFVLWN